MSLDDVHDALKITEWVMSTIKEEMLNGTLGEGEKDTSIAGQFYRRDGTPIQVQITLFNYRMDINKL